VALDPVLAAARRIGARARARGEISSDALERMPILLLAPGMLVTIWNRMFPEESLDPSEVFRSYLQLVFDRPADGSGAK
jgi:hypothetical protein